MINFEQWMRNVLQEKGITQRQMAEMTDTTTHDINGYLRGKCFPGWYKLNHIVEGMGYRLEIVPADKPKDPDEIETAYFAGYEYGYKQAVKEVIKHLKGMKWYGGNKQDQRAEGVPEYYASGAGDLQRELQRTDAEEGHGGRLGAGAAEGDDPAGDDSGAAK